MSIAFLVKPASVAGRIKKNTSPRTLTYYISVSYGEAISKTEDKSQGCLDGLFAWVSVSAFECKQSVTF